MLARISAAVLVQTKGLGSVVVNMDVIADGCLQFFRTPKYATANPFVGDFREPALYRIDP
jgi:hypothetical protein